jgi:hypothetical protein
MLPAISMQVSGWRVVVEIDNLDDLYVISGQLRRPIFQISEIWPLVEDRGNIGPWGVVLDGSVAYVHLISEGGTR